MKTLNDAMSIFTIRTNHWKVIQTKKIHEWFTHNDTYNFLKRHVLTEKVIIICAVYYIQYYTM